MKRLSAFMLFGVCAQMALASAAFAKEKITAIYIPLADHYAGLLAHHKYRNEMKEADFDMQQMKSWDALRGRFMSGDVDMAFLISPLAMDMFAEKPNFRWVSLAHRDGNALAVNELLASQMGLPADRKDRKPTPAFGTLVKKWKTEKGAPALVAIPSNLSPHALILYKYLKDQGVTLAIGAEDAGADVVARAVAPPKAPEFIALENKEGRAAAFEQSLPWADVVETTHMGKVAWYSKDILKTPKGHVECIIIATDKAIKEKKKALAEVISYIHKAGKDLDEATQSGGEALRNVASIINKSYIEAHSVDAIVASLDKKLSAINYRNLNVDKPGLKQIMDLAVEAKTLKAPVNLDEFADESFSTEITKK